jgi:hypothetical protein
MSKNKVLSENTIRRFQKLANIGTLSENYMQEMHPGYPAAQETPAQDEMEGQLPEQMDEEEVEVGLEGGGDKEKLVRDLLKLVSQLSGVEMDVAGEEGEAGEEEMGGDAGDMMGAAGALEAGEEEGEEDEEEGEEEEGGEEDEGMNEAEELDEEKDEVEESASASEDSMVESIVRRVTARLLEEAKKGKKKMTAKQKMALKKAQKGKKGEAMKAAKPVEEATAATGGGPLLKKGGNKHDVWAGTPDMTLAKGEKGGAGGHKLAPLKGTKKNAV